MRGVDKLTSPFDLMLLVVTVSLMLAFGLTPTQDVFLYQCYGTAFWQGGNALFGPMHTWCQQFIPQLSSSPFQTIPSEYPLFTLIIFSLPLLVPVLSYSLAFTVLLSILVCVLFFYLRIHFSPKASLLFVISVLLCVTTIGSRYDLVPATLIGISLLAAEKKQFSKAYLFLGLATILKLYPLMLLAPLVITEQQAFSQKTKLWQRFVPVGYFVLGLLGCLSFAMLLSPHHALDFVTSLINRPMQIESVPASIVWLLWLLHQTPFSIAFVYASLGMHHVSPGISTLITIGSWFLLGGSTLFVLKQLWQKRWGLQQSCLTLLLLLLTTGKVLSPQYFIWLIPLVILTKHHTKPWLLLWFSLLFVTALLHPWLYPLLAKSINTSLHTPSETIFFAIAGLRNLLLIIATVYWFRHKSLPMR